MASLRPLSLIFAVLIVLLAVAHLAIADETSSGDMPTQDHHASTATAVFAGGCFWCLEGPFDRIDGVLSTVSGYTGGRIDNPTYAQVGTGRTGHVEAIEVTYDPAVVTYETLLSLFWHTIDPIQADGQFVDRGAQYRTAIFYESEEQRVAAEASKQAIIKELGVRSVRTPIVEASEFFPAETYHQDFYLNYAAKYKAYAATCGRAERLRQLWGEKAMRP